MRVSCKAYVASLWVSVAFGTYFLVGASYGFEFPILAASGTSSNGSPDSYYTHTHTKNIVCDHNGWMTG